MWEEINIRTVGSLNLFILEKDITRRKIKVPDVLKVFRILIEFFMLRNIYICIISNKRVL